MPGTLLENPLALWFLMRSTPCNTYGSAMSRSVSFIILLGRTAIAAGFDGRICWFRDIKAVPRDPELRGYTALAVIGEAGRDGAPAIS